MVFLLMSPAVDKTTGEFTHAGDEMPPYFLAGPLRGAVDKCGRFQRQRHGVRARCSTESQAS